MARASIDFRRWFDRMAPQTLQIALMLLYLNGFFALIGFMDRSDWVGFARVVKGTLGTVVGLVVVLSFITSGLLMANDRRLGYRIGLFAAFSPFLLRFWIYSDSPVTLWNRISGGNTVSLLFELALCALLLHPMSREHQRVWYR
ncbi:MAG: hypothetical protein FJW09_07295 [Actinobacteria bacterium]|nr:hypothetical protein [Actinomycetota bacterium]